MKLNLGSGYRRIEGYKNVDNDELVKPDYLVDLEDCHLPIEDNTVDEVRAHHIFEHIHNFIPLMKEIYRVCKHGARLDILVPHHFHDVFWGDVTHVRPITVAGMAQFSKSHCQSELEKFGSSSGVALKYDLDFKMMNFEFDYDPFYHDMINSHKARREAGTSSAEENFAFERLMREATNVAIHTKILMQAIKENSE